MPLVEERIAVVETRQLEILRRMEQHMEEESEDRKTLLSLLRRMDGRLMAVENQISVYKTIIKTFKFVAAAIILIITLKLGDISKLWVRIFG